MKAKKLALLSVTILCVTVVGYIVLGRSNAQSGNQLGFTLHIVQTFYPSDGSAPRVGPTKVRYQKTDGSWKNVVTHPNGQVSTGFGQPGRGVFHVSETEQKLSYIGPTSGRVITEEVWKKEPGFVGEETILGYKTLHIRNPEPNGQVTDTYICPTLQGYPLRILITSSSGSKTVHEVTQVTLGEPSFEAMPGYPVDKSHFEERYKN